MRGSFPLHRVRSWPRTQRGELCEKLTGKSFRRGRSQLTELKTGREIGVVRIEGSTFGGGFGPSWFQPRCSLVKPPHGLETGQSKNALLVHSPVLPANRKVCLGVLGGGVFVLVLWGWGVGCFFGGLGWGGGGGVLFLCGGCWGFGVCCGWWGVFVFVLGFWGGGGGGGGFLGGGGGPFGVYKAGHPSTKMIPITREMSGVIKIEKTSNQREGTAAISGKVCHAWTARRNG